MRRGSVVASTPCQKVLGLSPPVHRLPEGLLEQEDYPRPAH